MKFIKFLIPVLLLLMASCDNGCDDCCNKVIERGSFTILDSTTVYLSNYFGSEKVIFINSASGQEATYQISASTDTAIVNLVEECPEDALAINNLEWKAEVRNVQLENLANGGIISIQHRSAIDINDTNESNESIFILEGPLNDLQQVQSAEAGLLVIIPTSDETLFTIKSDSLVIGNKVFYDVYETDISNTGFEDGTLSENISIKYSKLEGIIQITDKLTNNNLIYDRTE